jgi:hypothetical protein
LGKRHNSPHTGGPLEDERLVARRTFRIGVQQLSYVLVPVAEGNPFRKKQYYVAIKNRTYYSKHPIPRESVKRWVKALTS